MTDPERDPAVDAWLTSRRPLLRSIDDAHELEPPIELDRMVLERAQRELRQPVQNKRGFFRSASWMAPMSIAATVLLSFLLVLQFNQYEQRQQSQAALNAAPSSEMTVAQVPSPATTDLAESVAKQDADQRLAQAVARSATSSAPMPTVSRAAARSRAEPVDAAADAAASPPTYAKAETAGNAVSAVVADAATPVAVAASEAPASAAPAAAPPVAARAATAAERAAPASMAAGAAAAAKIDAPRSLSPQQWWDKIEKLRRNGEAAAAQREWEALHRAYPDFVAPPPASAAPTPPASPSR